MTSEQSATTGRVPGVPDELADDPEVLRAQIEETRAEVSKTVEALAAKADVKAQVKDKVDDVKEQLAEKRDEMTAKAIELKDQATAVTPDQARDFLGTVAQLVKERPMVAFAAGVLVGLILGKTRR